MSDEGQLLNADDHFSGEAEFLEEARRCCGTLQTADILEIESGSKLNGMTGLFFRRNPVLRASNAGVVNLFVDQGEILSKHRIFETKKLVVGVPDHLHAIAPCKMALISRDEAAWPVVSSSDSRC